MMPGIFNNELALHLTKEKLPQDTEFMVVKVNGEDFVFSEYVFNIFESMIQKGIKEVSKNDLHTKIKPRLMRNALMANLKKENEEGLSKLESKLLPTLQIDLQTHNSKALSNFDSCLRQSGNFSMMSRQPYFFGESARYDHKYFVSNTQVDLFRSDQS